MRWTREALASADLCWILTLTWAGRVLRFSSKPCTTLDDDGNVLPYDGGLDPGTVEIAIQGPGGTPRIPALTVDLFLPADLDHPALIEEGADLDTATAELALIDDGAALSERRVYLSGRVSSYTYGEVDEPVSLEIDGRPWVSSALLLGDDARITAERWPTAPDAAIGKYGVIPIGYPGHLDGGTTAKGTPAYAVEVSGSVTTVAIASCRVGSGSVTLYADDETPVTLAVATTTDALGKVWSAVDITHLGSAYRTAGTYSIAWPRSGGGGVQVGGKAIEGAGDVLAWALRADGRDIDRGRFAAAAPILNAYTLAGCIEEPVTGYDWITDAVMAGLPFELLHTGAAVAPVVWQPFDPPSTVLDTLEIGRNCSPVTVIAGVGAEQRINEIALSYAIDADGQAQQTLTAGDTAATGPIAATISRARYGVSAKALSLPMVWSTATAHRIASSVLALSALGRRELTVDGDPHQLGHLAPGDRVLFTDADRAISERVALVLAVRWIGTTTVEIDLTLYRTRGRDLASPA